MVPGRARARHKASPRRLGAPPGTTVRAFAASRSAHRSAALTAQEFLVGERFFLEERENLLFWRLQAGPLGVNRDVVRYVVLRRPMDALRRPDALDESFVHELTGPLSDVGEGRGRNVEHVPTFLLRRFASPTRSR